MIMMRLDVIQQLLHLKTNLLLWRDKFEDALSTNLPEPTTPEYEKATVDSKGEDDLLEIDI